MRTEGVLVALLLSAFASVDLVAGSLVERLGDWPEPWVLLLLSMAFSQISLAAIWCGLGGTALPWRLLGVVATGSMWGLLILPIWHGGGTVWLALFLSQALVILALRLLFRAGQWRLVSCTRQPNEARGNASRRPLQFSLGYLLSWITSAAVILGLLKYWLRFEDFSAAPLPWRAIMWVAIGHGAVAMASVWMVFGVQRIGARAALLALATIVALVTLDLGTTGPTTANAGLLCMQLAWLLPALVVVRVAGYRLRPPDSYLARAPALRSVLQESHTR